MKDFLGIMLIVFAAMISESLSSSKTKIREGNFQTKRVNTQKLKEVNGIEENKPNNLVEAYQVLVDSTQREKEKLAKK